MAGRKKQKRGKDGALMAAAGKIIFNDFFYRSKCERWKSSVEITRFRWRRLGGQNGSSLFYRPGAIRTDGTAWPVSVRFILMGSTGRLSGISHELGSAVGHKD